MSREFLRETVDYKGYAINIYYDNDAESPRSWDNLGTIYSNHRDYNPDDHSIEELLNDDGRLDEDELSKYFIWLPVYAYIHSGITVSTGHGYPYNDRWDSGLFGIIAVSKERVKKEYGWKIITQKRREQIEKYLDGEIEILDQWYTGDVYGYVIEIGEDSEDEVELPEIKFDSCWGFFGEEGVDEMVIEAKANIDAELEAYAKAEAARIERGTLFDNIYSTTCCD